MFSRYKKPEASGAKPANVPQKKVETPEAASVPAAQAPKSSLMKKMPKSLAEALAGQASSIS